MPSYPVRIHISKHGIAYHKDMIQFTTIAAIVVGITGALQIPFIETGDFWKPIPTLTTSIIDSTSLQNDINVDNLLKRAKKLFEIAELSEDEYNHPTRVIGSKGIRSLNILWDLSNMFCRTFGYIRLYLLNPH